MKFQVLELVDLDADAVHNAHAADAFDELLLLQRMRRAGHDVDLHPARARERAAR